MTFEAALFWRQYSPDNILRISTVATGVMVGVTPFGSAFENSSCEFVDKTRDKI